MSYLAFVWDCADPNATRVAQRLLRSLLFLTAGWHRLYEARGVIVVGQGFTNEEGYRTYDLPGHQGVVLGRLFARGAEEAPGIAALATAIAAPCGARVVPTGGRSLLDDYWGEYVAFAHDSQAATTWILRDPTGGIPCHQIRIEDVDVYFSSLVDLQNLGSLPLSINPHYLLGYLVFNSTCTGETGLSEISTVLAGECVEHRQHRKATTFYWNPLKLADGNSAFDPARAADLMRQTVRACVHSWAPCFQRILLQLSGGLDSSIVLSCLKSAPGSPEVLCSNTYSRGAQSDERLFARRAAERAGCELLEYESSAAIDFRLLDRRVHAVSPFPRFGTLESRRTQGDLLHRRKIGAVFTGIGGDELFCRHSPLPTVVDYAWQNPRSLSAIRLALAGAAGRNTSVWRVLRQVFRSAFPRRTFSIRRLSGGGKRHALMSSNAREDARRNLTLWHPLYRTPAELPPGKFFHAHSITIHGGRGHIPELVDGERGAAIGVNPLLSQPVMELCLRIPTYVLSPDGSDRVIARRAFERDLPEEIARRTSKGTTHKPLWLALKENREHVRELLLDGFLVKSGILDRAKTEVVLSGDISSIECHPLELFEYIFVETWVRDCAALLRCRVP